MGYRTLAYHYTWWRGDQLPSLPALAGFRVEATENCALLGQLHGLDPEEMSVRIAEGSQPYVAFIEDTPVAYGWSAARTFGVVAAGLLWTLRPGDRGFWDFVTLSAWRGRGIYPRLLQAIVQIEADAERFWIGHRADNDASLRGICNAGFQLIGITVWTETGEWVEVIRGDHERAHANPMAADMRLIEADDSELTLGDVEGL